MTMRRLGLAILATVTGITGCAAHSVAAARTPLSIVTATARYRFKVEVARTPEQQARGLMFRRSLAPDRGMIFPMSPPRYASFWMKNTLIPLDLLFIRPNGSIARIAAQAIPLSLQPIDSGEPVAAVLEIAGGRAAALGIGPDDKIVWTHKSTPIR